MLALCSVVLGCVPKTLISDYPPTPLGINKNPGSDSSEKLNPSTKHYVNDMFSRLQLKFGPGAVRKHYTQEIKKCLGFLVQEFGAPLYHGKVFLHITSNSSDNGKMAWSDNRRKHRTITLHEFNFLASELRVVVHELFHAFYQTNAFIKANPDFITEGLAVYAENKFRYPRKNNKQILEHMRLQSQGFNHQSINFDMPFQSYTSQDKDMIYILSGRLFFSQNPRTINHKIPKILVHGSSFKTRMPFKKLLVAYDLATTEQFLKTQIADLRSLPEPVKISNKASPTCYSTSHKACAKHYVQIASYSNKKSPNLRAWANKIQDKGLATKLRTVSKGSKTIFILYAGPFDDLRTAEKLRHELLHQGWPKDMKLKSF